MTIKDLAKSPGESAKTSQKDARYYINSAITILLMFGFQFLPTFGPVTHQGMCALGIFLGLLWAWSFVDFIWPSLLGIAAVGLSGFMTIDQAFSAAFGNTTTIMICAVFVLAAFLTSTGVCRTIAYWFVSRKSCKGRPYLIIFFLFTAMYILGGTAGTNATYIVGWAIAYEIAEMANYEHKDKLPAILVVGTVVSAALGATMFSFRAFAVIVLNTSKQILGLDVSLVGWFVPSFLASFSALVLLVLAIKFVIRPDVSALTGETDVFANFRGTKLSKEEKIGIGALVFVIICAALPSFLPAGTPLRVFMSKFSIGPIIMITLAALYLVRVNGKPLIDYQKHIKNGIDWNTIIMLASSFPVASMMQNADSGVTALINSALLGLLGGYDAFALGVIFMLFTIVMTQVAHNMVLVIVLAPIICNLSTTMGFDAMPLLVMLAFAANTGLMTPGASVMGAMIYANPWVSAKRAFAYTGLAVAIMAVTICLIGLPVGMMMNLGIPV